MKIKKITISIFMILMLQFSIIQAGNNPEQTVSQNENPDISSIIDFFGMYNNKNVSANKFYFRFANLMIRQSLTPWTSGTVILVKPGNSETALAVEEVYALFNNLPFSMLIQLGKFHTDFGYINKLHKHQLPTFNHPDILYYIFDSAYPDTSGKRILKGDEPNGDIGLQISTLLPLPFYSELEIGLLDGKNDIILNDGKNMINTYLIRSKNYWDISDSIELNLWFSGLGGKSPINKAATYIGNTYLGFKIKSKKLPEFRYFQLDSEFYYRTLIKNKNDIMDRLMGYYIRGLYAFRILYQHQIGLQYSSVIPENLGVKPIDNSLDLFLTMKVFRNTEFKLDWNANITNSKSIVNKMYFECTFTLGPHRHLL